MPWRRGAWIHVWIRVSIHGSGTIRIRLSGASVVRRRRAWTAAICGICGRLPLRSVILRSWLVWPLLILVWPLLVRPLLILIGSPLVLIRPLILGPVLPPLQLSVAELPKWSATALDALARRHDNAQAEEQDCPGYCRRTHSFRVGSPIHESFSR